jgi:hypothetical protein
MKKKLKYLMDLLLIAILFYYSYRIKRYYYVNLDGYLLSITIPFTTAIILLYGFINKISNE